MASADPSMWWYAGLRAVVLDAIFRPCCHGQECWEVLTGPRHAQILDVGAGTGGMLRVISEAQVSHEWRLVALDSSEQACEILRERLPGMTVLQSDAASLPFGAGTFDAVLCLDVLGHRSVTPAEVLKEIYRVLRPGGRLVVNVSAYRWLLSYHDIAVNQTTRFSRRELSALLEDAGFHTCRTTYWNTLLFPAMVIRRKILPRRDGMSDVSDDGRLIEAVGGAAMRLERVLLKRGVRLPFGGSVLAVARR